MTIINLKFLTYNFLAHIRDELVMSGSPGLTLGAMTNSDHSEVAAYTFVRYPGMVKSGGFLKFYSNFG